MICLRCVSLSDRSCLVTAAGPAATVAYSIAVIWTHSFSEDNCNVCIVCMKTLLNVWYVTAWCEDVTHVWQLAVMPPVCQPQPRSSLRVSSNDTFCWCLAFFNLSREGGIATQNCPARGKHCWPRLVVEMSEYRIQPDDVRSVLSPGFFLSLWIQRTQLVFVVSCWDWAGS